MPAPSAPQGARKRLGPVPTRPAPCAGYRSVPSSSGHSPPGPRRLPSPLLLSAVIAAHLALVHCCYCLLPAPQHQRLKHAQTLRACAVCRGTPGPCRRGAVRCVIRVPKPCWRRCGWLISISLAAAGRVGACVSDDRVVAAAEGWLCRPRCAACARAATTGAVRRDAVRVGAERAQGRTGEGRGATLSVYGTCVFAKTCFPSGRACRSGCLCICNVLHRWRLSRRREICCRP